jgi:hypothetical protein
VSESAKESGRYLEMDQPRNPQMNGQDGAAAVDEPVVRTIDDFPDDVRRYNTQWLVQKNAYLSPADARQRWLD